jgi:quercetin dioxygenase-like cupin family protein
MRFERVDRNKGEEGNPAHYQGRVKIQHFPGPFPGGVEILAVHFDSASRTRPHVHDRGQVLHITSGKGIVASGSGRRFVEQGDVVIVKPNEWHWHGGTTSSAMTHVAIQMPGSTDFDVDQGDWANDYDEIEQLSRAETKGVQWTPLRKGTIMNLNAANHYVLEGVISGTIDTSSINGLPAVSLQFKGAGVPDAKLQDSIAGLQVTATLGARPDLDSQTLLMLLPVVNVTDAPVLFAGVALVVNARTSVGGPRLVSSVGGPRLVSGMVQSYEIYPAMGTASLVEF